MSKDFVCNVCGTSHAGLPTDWAFTLPDDVWAIPSDCRAQHATFDTDLYLFGDRHFIRGLLAIRFTEMTGRYGWGVWVEESSFARYLQLYSSDGPTEPRYPGLLANAPKPYDSSLANVCSSSLKTYRLVRACTWQFMLAVEQRRGMDAREYHELLDINAGRNQTLT